MSGQGRRVEIVIPVRNIWWIGVLARVYRGHGLAPIWIVDRGSHWLFRALAWAVCRRRQTVRPTARRAETMLEPVIAGLASDWVVRLDGDEIPSPGLIALIARLEAGEDPGHDYLGITRRWLREGPTGIEVSMNGFFGHQGRDYQYRIWRRAEIEITRDIHTPGIVIRPERVGFAADDCVIWHFNWICYSLAERRAKIASYDAQRQGAGSGFREFYLPEEAPERYSFQPMEGTASAAPIRRIARFRRSAFARLLLWLGPS